MREISNPQTFRRYSASGSRPPDRPGGCRAFRCLARGMSNVVVTRSSPKIGLTLALLLGSMVAFGCASAPQFMDYDYEQPALAPLDSLSAAYRIDWVVDTRAARDIESFDPVALSGDGSCGDGPEGLSPLVQRSLQKLLQGADGAPYVPVRVYLRTAQFHTQKPSFPQTLWQGDAEKKMAFVHLQFISRVDSSSVREQFASGHGEARLEVPESELRGRLFASALADAAREFDRSRPFTEPKTGKPSKPYSLSSTMHGAQAAGLVAGLLAGVFPVIAGWDGDPYILGPIYGWSMGWAAGAPLGARTSNGARGLGRWALLANFGIVTAVSAVEANNPDLRHNDLYPISLALGSPLAFGAIGVALEWWGSPGEVASPEWSVGLAHTPDEALGLGLRKTF